MQVIYSRKSLLFHHRNISRTHDRALLNRQLRGVVMLHLSLPSQSSEMSFSLPRDILQQDSFINNRRHCTLTANIKSFHQFFIWYTLLM